MGVSRKFSVSLIAFCLLAVEASATTLHVFGPAQRKEGPLPAVLEGESGTFRVDVYVDEVASLRAFQLTADLPARGFPPVEDAGKAGDAFGGAEVQYNLEALGESRPIRSGNTFGVLIPASVHISPQAQDDNGGLTLLFSISYRYSSNHRGTYSIALDQVLTVLGDDSFIPKAISFDVIPGTVVIEGGSEPPCAAADASANSPSAGALAVDGGGMLLLEGGGFSSPDIYPYTGISCLEGDANNDGTVNILDMLYINYRIGGDVTSSRHILAADVDGDSDVDTNDVSYAQARLNTTADPENEAHWVKITRIDYAIVNGNDEVLETFPPLLADDPWDDYTVQSFLAYAFHLADDRNLRITTTLLAPSLAWQFEIRWLSLVDDEGVPVRIPEEYRPGLELHPYDLEDAQSNPATGADIITYDGGAFTFTQKISPGSHDPTYATLSMQTFRRADPADPAVDASMAVGPTFSVEIPEIELTGDEFWNNTLYAPVGESVEVTASYDGQGSFQWSPAELVVSTNGNAATLSADTAGYHNVAVMYYEDDEFVAMRSFSLVAFTVVHDGADVILAPSGDVTLSAIISPPVPGSATWTWQGATTSEWDPGTTSFTLTSGEDGSAQLSVTGWGVQIAITSVSAETDFGTAEMPAEDLPEITVPSMRISIAGVDGDDRIPGPGDEGGDTIYLGASNDVQINVETWGGENAWVVWDLVEEEGKHEASLVPIPAQNGRMLELTGTTTITTLSATLYADGEEIATTTFPEIKVWSIELPHDKFYYGTDDDEPYTGELTIPIDLEYAHPDVQVRVVKGEQHINVRSGNSLVFEENQDANQKTLWDYPTEGSIVLDSSANDNIYDEYPAEGIVNAYEYEFILGTGAEPIVCCSAGQPMRQNVEIVRTADGEGGYTEEVDVAVIAGIFMAYPDYELHGPPTIQWDLHYTSGRGATFTSVGPDYSVNVLPDEEPHEDLTIVGKITTNFTEAGYTASDHKKKHEWNIEEYEVLRILDGCGGGEVSGRECQVRGLEERLIGFPEEPQVQIKEDMPEYGGEPLDWPGHIPPICKASPDYYEPTEVGIQSAHSLHVDDGEVDLYKLADYRLLVYDLKWSPDTETENRYVMANIDDDDHPDLEEYKVVFTPLLSLLQSDSRDVTFEVDIEQQTQDYPGEIALWATADRETPYDPTDPYFKPYHAESLYVEGLQPGKAKFTLRLVKTGEQDVEISAEITVIQIEIVIPDSYDFEAGMPTPGAGATPAELLCVSDPRPSVTITSHSVSIGSQSATVTLNGYVLDPIADNVPRGDGADVQSVDVTVNGSGGTQAQIVQGSDGDPNFWRQHPYKGTFGPVSINVPLEEGTHIVRVETSENAAGRIGWGELAVSLGKRIIPGSSGGTGTITLNIAFDAEPTLETADTIRYYYGDRAPDPEDAVLSEEIGQEDSFIFLGEFDDVETTVTITSINSQPVEQFAGFNPNAPDVLEAEVTYTLSGGSTMTFAGTFTETDDDGMRFTAEWVVTIGMPTAPPMEFVNIYLPRNPSPNLNDHLIHYAGERLPDASDPVLVETATDSMVFEGYYHGISTTIVITNFNGLTSGIDILDAEITYMYNDVQITQSDTLVETHVYSGIFRTEMTAIGYEPVAEGAIDWAASSRAIHRLGQADYLPFMMRVMGLDEEELEEYELDINDGGLEIELEAHDGVFYARGASKFIGYLRSQKVYEHDQVVTMYYLSGWKRDGEQVVRIDHFIGNEPPKDLKLAIQAHGEEIGVTETETFQPLEVYLTFDDGPREGTEVVLRVLGDEKVPATFFLIGSAFDYPRVRSLGKAVREGGFFVGNHTLNHRYRRSDYEGEEKAEAQLKDVEDNNAELAKWLGDPADSKYKFVRLPGKNAFRLPGLTRDDGNSTLAASLIAADGYLIYGWDREWGGQDVNIDDAMAMLKAFTDTIEEKRLTKTPNKFIMLAHDNDFRKREEQLKRLIRELKNLQDNYKIMFRTIDEY